MLNFALTWFYVRIIGVKDMSQIISDWEFGFSLTEWAESLVICCEICNTDLIFFYESRFDTDQLTDGFMNF